MQIIVNPLTSTVTLDGVLVRIDAYYEVDDEHRLIVRAGGVIQLKKGKKTVWTVTMPQVSGVAGTSDCGDVIPQVFKAEVVTDRPIFPQVPLVRQLLSLGVEWWQIHLMNESQMLYHTVAAHSSPVMTCGSESAERHTTVPAHGDLMTAVSFTVRPEARWAILNFDDTPISSIYLWPGAADDGTGLMSKLNELRSVTT